MKLGFVLSFIALHHYDLFIGEEYFTLQLRREKIPKSVQVCISVFRFIVFFLRFHIILSEQTEPRVVH